MRTITKHKVSLFIPQIHKIVLFLVKVLHYSFSPRYIYIYKHNVCVLSFPSKHMFALITYQTETHTMPPNAFTKVLMAETLHLTSKLSHFVDL
jgi:hypothetical protein